MKETTKDYLKYIKPLIFTIIIISAIAIILQPQVRQNITPCKIREFVNNYGSLSAVIFLSIYTLRPLLLILPVSAFAIAGGSLFGAGWGSVYAIIGNVLSASLAFFIARYLMREFIESIVGNKKKYIEGNLEKNGVKIIAVARVVFPFDILSYVSGVSSIKYRKFIAGTLITSSIEMTFFNIVGDNIRMILTRGMNRRVIFLTVFVLISGVVLILYKKGRSQNE